MITDDSSEVTQETVIPKNAKISMFLGIGSVIAFFILIPLSIFVEVFGASFLFRTIIVPLAVGAVILGVMARREIGEKELPGWRQASAGIILGSVSLLLIIVSTIIIALFFSLMLFESR